VVTDPLPASATPKITVVIPVYNHAAVLARALASVAAQTFQDYEIIVVDDGSVDDVAGTLRDFHHLRLRLLRHPENRGAAAARNTGVAEARAPYVAFLDADDEWLAGKLARQIAHIEGASEIYGICTGYSILRPGVAEAATYIPPLERDTEHFTTFLFGCRISPGSTLMVSRRSFDEIGPFDESLRRLEDWDWLIRYSRRWRLHVVSEPLVRVHGSASPDVNQVLLALEALQQKYVQGGALSSPREVRQFQSSIMVEKAAAHYRRGAILPAVYHVCCSLGVYPRRNTAFFRQVLQRMLGR
jgi:glycosyltransferase involved in cell wall biosynthesis